MNESNARKLVYERSMRAFDSEVPICEVCGLRRKDSWSHRRPRSQGGLWTPSNGMAACGDGTRGCHGALTTPPRGHREGFVAKGWLVPSWASPANVPVLHAALGWVLLDDEGDWLPVSASGG